VRLIKNQYIKSMTSTDWMLLIFCIIYIISIAIGYQKVKRKHSDLTLKKFLLSSVLYIPGMLVFVVLIVRLLRLI